MFQLSPSDIAQNCRILQTAALFLIVNNMVKWGSSSLDLLGHSRKAASNTQASVLFGAGQLFPNVNLCLKRGRLLTSARIFLRYKVEGLSQPHRQTLEMNILHRGSYS